MGTNKVSDLLNDLPNEDLANNLVDDFFVKFNFVRYPISEFLFRQSFSALYADRSINPTAVLAMPLVFIVLAIAMRCAPDEWFEGETEKKRHSLRMYWNCKSSVAIGLATNVQLEVQSPSHPPS